MTIETIVTVNLYFPEKQKSNEATVFNARQLSPTSKSHSDADSMTLERKYNRKC